MTPRKGSAGVIPRVPRKDAHSAIRAALRRYVGAGRPWTTVRLSEEAGVPLKSIECAICEVGSEHWRPLPVDRLLSIAAVLGAEFTSLWLAVARQGSFDHAPYVAPRPGEIVATMAGHTATIAAILVDGFVSDEERPMMLAISADKAAQAGVLARMAAMS